MATVFDNIPEFALTKDNHLTTVGVFAASTLVSALVLALTKWEMFVDKDTGKLVWWKVLIGALAAGALISGGYTYYMKQ